MTHRDTYFFDLCREACLDPLDHWDWINIGALMKEAEDIGEVE